MKKNNERREQKQKPYSDKKKYKNKDAIKKVHVKKEVVSEDVLFESACVELEKNNIFLLELKIATLSCGKKCDNHIYAVIHKKENISHKDCVFTTKVMQDIIEDLGFDRDDYSITVSSAGFTWLFKSDLEYEVFLGEKIKIKYREDEKNNTLQAVLKENSKEYIVVESEEIGRKQINKKDIIKTRLNN